MVAVEYVRSPLYPKQEAAVFAPQRYSIIEASTKSGKTAGCMVWLIEQALQAPVPDLNYWWVAPFYGQARIVYRRMKRAIPQALYVANEQELTLTLANGSTLWFKSADKPDGLYGEDVMAAVVDEASRVKEPAWHAVRSTLTATRGPVRLIGNVKGRRNWFYKLARKAEAGERNMAYHKMTAIDAVEAGVLPLSEVEDARRVLPADVYNELYLAEPSEDGSNPFGLGHINACIIPAMSPFDPAAWGWDLAKKRDWTVGIALDGDNMVCRFQRFRKSWGKTKEVISTEVGYVVPALLDATGVGDPIVEELQIGRDNVEGYIFTSPRKQMLMLGLASAIQSRNVGIPEGIIADELREFEYVYTPTGVKYQAPQGMHDDCVSALGLCVEARTRPFAGGILLQGRTRGWSPAHG